MKTLEALQIVLESSYGNELFEHSIEMLSSNEIEQKNMIITARALVVLHIKGMANGKPIANAGSICKRFANGNV